MCQESSNELGLGGEPKCDTVDADVMDLVTQVQLNVKLPVQLESRMRDMEEATYCTLFLTKESDSVREMQDATRVFSELVSK